MLSATNSGTPEKLDFVSVHHDVAISLWPVWEACSLKPLASHTVCETLHITHSLCNI